MERLHPMMKYGNFIEVYNNIKLWLGDSPIEHVALLLHGGSGGAKKPEIISK